MFTGEGPIDPVGPVYTCGEHIGRHVIDRDELLEIALGDADIKRLLDGEHDFYECKPHRLSSRPAPGSALAPFKYSDSGAARTSPRTGRVAMAPGQIVVRAPIVAVVPTPSLVQTAVDPMRPDHEEDEDKEDQNPQPQQPRQQHEVAKQTKHVPHTLLRKWKSNDSDDELPYPTPRAREVIRRYGPFSFPSASS